MAVLSRRWMTAAFAVVSALALVAGCNRGGTPDPGDGETPKVTILIGGSSMSWSPLYLAVDKGFFVEQGVEVDLVVSQQGATGATAAVVTGDAFMAFTGALAALQPVKAGAPVRLVACVAVKFAPQLVATQEFLDSHNITPDSPLDEKIRALRGATLGGLGPGQSPDQYFAFLFSTVGMNVETDATLLALGSSSSQLAALQNKSVEVIAASPPLGANAEAGGFGTIFLRPSEVRALANYPFSVGLVNTRSLTESPDVVKSVVAGIAQGIDYMKNDPDGARADLRKRFPDFSEADFESVFADTVDRLPESLVLSADQFQVMEDFAEVQGDPLGVNYEEAVTTELAQAGVDQYNESKSE